MKTENVFFTSGGRRLAGIVHLPAQSNPPCVIASHGLLSSKDSEKYQALGARLAGEGMVLLRFDFSGIGESEGRPEEDTVTRRIADLGAAITYVAGRFGLGVRMGLVGSSLGGYVSLFQATAKGIKATVIWATPFHLDDLKTREQADDYPLPAEPFFDDLPRHRLSSFLPKVSNCLVIHGESDELVPVDQAWEIFQGLGDPKEIHVLEGGDHRLTEPSHRQRAIDLTADWFKKFL